MLGRDLCRQAFQHGDAANDQANDQAPRPLCRRARRRSSRSNTRPPRKYRPSCARLSWDPCPGQRPAGCLWSTTGLPRRSYGRGNHRHRYLGVKSLSAADADAYARNGSLDVDGEARWRLALHARSPPQHRRLPSPLMFDGAPALACRYPRRLKAYIVSARRIGCLNITNRPWADPDPIGGRVRSRISEALFRRAGVGATANTRYIFFV